MSTVGSTLLVALKGADEELPTRASIPSAFDYILLFSFFFCLFVSQLNENERERFRAAETKAPSGQ